MKVTFDSGRDAVFLPGTIHGCEWQAYILTYNDQANNSLGSFDIRIVDKERILKLYNEVNGNAEEFFEYLPDYFHGEWKYCDKGNPDYDDYCRTFYMANFIEGKDGDAKDEMNFLVTWAAA